MPITLYDESGAPVQVPEAEVSQALFQRGLGFAPGQRVVMRSPDGETYEHEAADALQALRAGWTLETPEESFQRRAEEEYGSGTRGALLAPAYGFLRQASFGGMDKLASSLGDEEYVRMLETARPGGMLLGEVVGGFAPLLMGNWAGAPALISRAGRLVEMALGATKAARAAKTAAGAGGALARVGMKGLEMGAAGATEGALFGLSQFISERAIGGGDAESSAESILSHLGATVGMGALWGGGLGGAFGFGFEAVPAAAKVTQRAAKDTWKFVKRPWEKFRGDTAKAVTQAPDDVERFFAQEGAEAASRPSAPAPSGEQIQQAIDNKLIPQATLKGIPDVERQRAVRPDSWFDEQSTAYTRMEDEAHFHKDQLVDEATVHKEALMKRAAAVDASMNEPIAYQAVTSMLKAAERELAGMAEAGAGFYGGQPGIGKLRKFIAAQQVRVERARKTAWQRILDLEEKAGASKGAKARKIQQQIQDANGEVVGEYMILADQAKREIGRVRSSMNALRNTTTADLDTMGALAGLYLNTFRVGLEDAGVWGAKAATIQREFNAAWTPFMQQIKGYRQDFPTRVPWLEEDFGITQAAPQGKQGKIYRTDPARVKRLMKAIGSLDSQLQEEYLNNVFRLEGDLLAVIEKHAGQNFKLQAGRKLNKAERAAAAERQAKFKLHLESYKLARKQQQAIMQEVRSTNASQRALAALDEGSRLAGIMPEEGGSVTKKLWESTMAGTGIQHMLAPARVVRRQAAIDRVVRSASDESKKGVLRYLKAGAERAWKGLGQGKAWEKIEGARPLITPLAVPLTRAKAKAEERQEREERSELLRARVREVASLATQRGPALEQLRRSLEPIGEVAPQIAQALEQKAVSIASFLADKAPRDPTRPGLLGSKESRWQASDLELAQFERYYRAATQPATIADDLAEGDLSFEAAEVLRVCYPAMHRTIVSEVLARLDELGDEVPYGQRVMLSNLLGVPTDPTLEGDFVAWLHAPGPGAPPAPASPGAPGAGAPRGPTQRSIDRIDTESHLTTPQRLASA